MFVLREGIRNNNPQEFITGYSVNDHSIKLNRCYNSRLILQKIDNHIFTLKNALDVLPSVLQPEWGIIMVFAGILKHRISVEESTKHGCW